MSHPKVKGEITDISLPFSIRHTLHLDSEDIVAKAGDIKRRFPPSPRVGNKDSFSAFSLPDESSLQSLSEHLLAKIIPAIRKETGDIYERKFQAMSDKLTSVLKSENSLCSKCACSELQVNVSLQSLSEQLLAEIIPAIRKETEDIYERKFQSMSDKLTSVLKSGNSLCSKCACSELQVKVIPVDIAHVHESVGNDIEIHSISRTEKLVKNGSEMHPVHRVSMRHHSGRKFTTRRGVSRDNPDERECMADALQKNIVQIVNNVIFNDSELPDCLLEDGCLTENESIRCRKQADPKDQVRMLISLIKGRDIGVLKRFLKQIKSHNEHIGLIIEQQFNQNVERRLKSTVCALCKLTQRVDLKYIADILYQYGLLEDGLYNIIFQTEKPVGAQDDIWHQVLYWLNDQCKERKDFVKNVLTEALVQKDHYSHLAKEIERLIDKMHSLVCQCRVEFVKPVRDSELSFVSSRSPASSTDTADSANFETDPEPSDTENREKPRIQTSVNSNNNLPQRDLHHIGKTNPEGQHETTHGNKVKILVAEYQKKTKTSTCAFKLNSKHPEPSKFEPVELRPKKESKTSDEEYKGVNNRIRNKQEVFNRRKAIYGLPVLMEEII